MRLERIFQPAVGQHLHSLGMADAMRFWDAAEKKGREQKQLYKTVRGLVQEDLFYLLVRVCGRIDLINDWQYARVREVEASPNGHLDLWAREHGKSSIITFGLTISDILNDPDITFGIFSHTRPIAKAFLRQIMREFESNAVLHESFPDVLWGHDIRAAPKWSEDDGIIVKRKSNPNEATIEAWGLVDGQPTSKHFRVLLYDDIVVAGSVTTPEMIAKTMVEMERSYNLGTTPGIKRGAGTRWAFGDTYRTVVDRGTFKLREYPGTDDGTEDGKPVYWTQEIMVQKRRDMGPHTFAAQILLNPKADALQGFKREWLRHYKRMMPEAWKKMNRYLLVDAASSKKKGSDYTAMGVLGLNVDMKFYLLDGIRDRLNLTERTARLIQLHRDWKINKPVRYERYGMMGDIEHIKSEQEALNYRFEIIEVGGQTKKIDRIGRLIPVFEQGNFWLPEHLWKTDYQKNVIDLVQVFTEEEFAPFPVGLHDDFLDMMARILEPDLKLDWPKEEKVREPEPQVPVQNASVAWMV